jgi:hypothetical protein
MRKTIITIAAAATFAVAAMAPSTASADNGRITAGVIGGLAAGALIGSAVSHPYYYGGPYGYYAAAEPVYGPRCYIQRERFFDGFGWRVRRVRVCD